jgi:hypothetical protein
VTDFYAPAAVEVGRVDPLGLARELVLCGRLRGPRLALRFGLRFQVDEVLFESLAIALETLPPFERRLLRASLGGLTAAGKLGARLATFLTEPGGLGRPVLVLDAVGFEGRLRSAAGPTRTRRRPRPRYYRDGRSLAASQPPD